MARDFDFRSQTYSVNQLLEAAVNVLPHLPEAQRVTLEHALERFETTCVPTAWTVEDISHFALSEDEAKDALDAFYEDYEIDDRDQERLMDAATRIAKERDISP